MREALRERVGGIERDIWREGAESVRERSRFRERERERERERRERSEREREREREREEREREREREELNYKDVPVLASHGHLN